MKGKNTLRRSLAKIAMHTMVAIFSLASVFAGTYAWFALNADVEVSGMSIKVSVGETDVDCLTVHRCNLSASTSSILKFDPNPSVVATGYGTVTTASGIKMDNYSTLNQTQPVLLLLTFNDGMLESDIEMTATSDTATFVGAATAQNIGSFPFSSAVTFKTATYSSAEFPFNNVQTADYSSDLSFVQITKDGNGVITNTSFNQEITIYNGNSNNSVKYLAIILDYYPDAIDYIINHTNYEVFSNHNNCIDFFCDWIMEL